MTFKRKLYNYSIYLLSLSALLIPLDTAKNAPDGIPPPGAVEILPKVKKQPEQPLRTLQRIPVSPQDYVKAEAAKYGWHEGYEWQQLHNLIQKESGWNAQAWNKQGSGACGLFQALPCSKLGAPPSDVKNQARWGLGYIRKRYGSPSEALYFWTHIAPTKPPYNGHWY